MGTLDEEDARPARHANVNVSHLIPAVELKGSRGEKLEKLDALIAHLQQLRRGLTGDLGYGKAPSERPGRYIDSPEWPWFVAGTSVGALIVLLLVFARSCA
jgi:hypothetical protein